MARQRLLRMISCVVGWGGAHPTSMSKTNEPRPWTAAEIPSQEGRRILVTGANSGIGFHAALKLARKGAEIIFACRDRQKGEVALDLLHSEAPSTHTELAILDLASLASVHEFAAQELSKNRPLHVLINNAGVMAPPKRQQTTDGFEVQFGTNVLGHFALTGLLLPALERADKPRVVTLASIAHKRGKLNFDDLQSTQSYSPMGSYQQSKLADLMLAFELDRRLRAASLPVMSIAVHPGVAHTNLFERGDHSPTQKMLRKFVSHAIGIILNTDSEGALPTLYAATAADAKSGGYYGPKGFQEMRGDEVISAQVAPQARDEVAAARLWKICEELTGVCYLDR
jgi:NAD(P)-dependent dehydrogenase (short-subunit alcohol dehydrogenase family)